MPPALAHETRTRLRVALAPAADAGAIAAALLQVPGVKSARLARGRSSIVVTHDGRDLTRERVLGVFERPHTAGTPDDVPHRSGEAFPVEASALIAALTPLLPQEVRPAVAVTAVGFRAAAALRQGEEWVPTLLDAIALGTTALTRHPLTATASLLLGSLAERRRNRLLQRMDVLLARLAPSMAATVAVERDGRILACRPDDVEVGDVLALQPGLVVPADGLVLEGRPGVVGDSPGSNGIAPCRPGRRLMAGTRVESGSGTMRIERPAALSRVARLRAHVRHALRARETPGPLTPDLERVIAVPMTAAALVLTLTGDPARSAAMLQADPQMGIGLAQPVAREAALYALAHGGVLLSGLESIDRLAAATTFAFQDVGVLAEPLWYIDRIETAVVSFDAEEARRWLGRVFGLERTELLEAGMLDAHVAAVRRHGVLLRAGQRTLHVGGANLLARTWDLPLPEPERVGLVRRLGIVEQGTLLATVFFTCRLREEAAAQLAQLRELGVRRIAVFSEDLTEDPAQVLTQIGADIVVHRSRVEQERWLDRAVEAGERVALVHTGLRDLLPPGGLSLCPVDAEAGAHGVLLGDPLASLLAARATARQARRELRGRFGRSVTLSSALMIAAALRWAPPWAIAAAKHGANFLLLEQSARLARLEPRLPEAARRRRAAPMR